MKLTILYTAFRQFDELDYQQKMFRRLSCLRSSANIIYHCNNSKLAQASIAEKLSRIPCFSMDFVYSPQKNQGGYPYGQFEAICDIWEKLVGNFEWIIHLHPDVFIVNEAPLLAAIKKAHVEGKDMLVTPIFGLKQPSYATDFFAFRPAVVPRAIFESYRNFDDTNIVVPLENLFFIEIHRARLNYSVVDRFTHGQYHRDIDLLGLWHEHNLRRVDLYLKSRWARWLPTCLRCLLHPYLTMRFIMNWCSRKVQGVAQDSLAQQLTAL